MTTFWGGWAFGPALHRYPLLLSTFHFPLLFLIRAYNTSPSGHMAPRPPPAAAAAPAAEVQTPPPGASFPDLPHRIRPDHDDAHRLAQGIVDKQGQTVLV